jgi:PKD repeat protein
MRNPRLSALLAGAAALLLIAGCSDSTAPLIAPDDGPSFAIDFDDPTCANTDIAWSFEDIPVVPDVDLIWLPGGHGDVTHAYQVLGGGRLQQQDNDGEEAIGRAYVRNSAGSNWVVQLNMPLKGHVDVLHLTATVSMRPNQNIMVLNHDFSVSMQRTRGIFEAAALINQTVRVTGSIDRPTRPGAKAAWAINAEVNTCGIPTRGPNDWFKVLECDGLKCKFWNTPIEGRDSRANPIQTWLWDFGDGRTSNVQYPVHTFPLADGSQTYAVTLTVTDEDGRTNPVVQPIYVTCENGSCAHDDVKRPLAEFTYECEGLFCQFTDRSLNYGDPITSWAWDFGDGLGTADVQDPSYEFEGADRYRVSLTVADAKGIFNTTSRDVIVTADDGGDPPPPNQPPVASFTYSCTDLTCSFTDTSTDSGGQVEAWSWTFGDGYASTDQHPSRTYAEAGTYTVALTVTDDDGAVDTASQDVTVTAGDEPPPDDPPPGDDPVASFTYSCKNTATCAFTDTSAGAITGWSWTFANASPATSHQQNPTATFDKVGNHEVVLTVTANGQEDSHTRTISCTVRGVLRCQ